MFDDDEPIRREGPLADLAREDLDRLSAHECEARIAALEAEIARTRRRLESAGSTRLDAEALFRS